MRYVVGFHGQVAQGHGDGDRGGVEEPPAEYGMYKQIVLVMEACMYVCMCLQIVEVYFRTCTYKYECAYQCTCDGGNGMLF